MGKDTTPWKGGGKRGQLNDLRNNRHPKNKTPIPPGIAESTMTLDIATAACADEVAEARRRSSRYTAKDKAVARTHAANPQAALTAEKQEWINNKRKEAIAQASRKRPPPVDPVLDPPPSTWAARIRAVYQCKRQRHEAEEVDDAHDSLVGVGDAAGPARMGNDDTTKRKAHHADTYRAERRRRTNRCFRLTCFDPRCEGTYGKVAHANSAAAGATTGDQPTGDKRRHPCDDAHSTKSRRRQHHEQLAPEGD